jgi:hypothetical protein
MVDLFAIGLTHALLALAAWRLCLRRDLDSDGSPVSGRASAPSGTDEDGPPRA